MGQCLCQKNQVSIPSQPIKNIYQEMKDIPQDEEDMSWQDDNPWLDNIPNNEDISLQQEASCEDENVFIYLPPSILSQDCMLKLPHKLIGAILFDAIPGQGTGLGTGLGTGVLISPDLVLTVAHNLVQQKKPVKNLRFYLGQHGPLKKQFYSCTKQYVPKQYFLNNQNPPILDYALLRLQRPTSVSEFMTLETVQRIEENDQFAIFGYPKSKEKQKQKNPLELFQSGQSKNNQAVKQFRKTQKDITYSLSTEGGQSGAPIILQRQNNKPVIIGIHKGTNNLMQCNWGRHIDPQLINELQKEAKKLGAIPFQQPDSDFEEGKKSMNEQKWEKAEEYFQKTLEKQPKHLTALYSLANVLLKQQKFEKSLKISDKTLKIHSNNVLAHNNRELALQGLKKYEEQKKNIEKAIQINLKQKEAFNIKGNVFLAQGKKQSAMDQYKKALNIDPNYKEAQGNLDGLKQKQDPKAANEFINQYVSRSALAAFHYKQKIEIDPSADQGYYKAQIEQVPGVGAVRRRGNQLNQVKKTTTEHLPSEVQGGQIHVQVLQEQ